MAKIQSNDRFGFNEHPTVSHQPFYGSSSGAKVNISFKRAKSIHLKNERGTIEDDISITYFQWL